MKLSSLASKNGDRGPGTSENKRKNSPHQVKPNTVNRPSNTSKPLYSPFHLLHSSDANGLLEQTIHVPNDRTSSDFTYQHHRRQPHPSRSRHSSPSHLRSPVLSPHHHPIHIHPPNDPKEIRSNSNLRIYHCNPHSSPFIPPNTSQSEPILDNDVDESTKKKENRKYIDSPNIPPAPDSNTTQNIKYSQPSRQHSVVYPNHSPNRSQSVDNNLSIVYSRNPRTPATKK